MGRLIQFVGEHPIHRHLSYYSCYDYVKLCFWTHMRVYFCSYFIYKALAQQQHYIVYLVVVSPRSKQLLFQINVIQERLCYMISLCLLYETFT